MSDRVCTTCVLCIREDTGYSNWTVMDTFLGCLAGLNPGLDSQSEPYGDVTPELAALLDVAKTCPRYREGAPAWLDVDQDGIPYDRKQNPVTAETIKKAGYTDDDEAATLLAARYASDV